MSVLDKLKDRKNLVEEMKKLGLKIVEDESNDEAPQITITDEDLENPAKLEAKINGAIATIHKNARAEIKAAKEEATQTAKETANDAELRSIREFLKGHQHTDPVKNKDVLELMDFYYAKGGTVEDAYKKACKSLDLEPGVVGEENKEEKKSKEKKEKKGEEEKEGVASRRSGTFEKASKEKKEEKEEKPLSIRDAAKEALAELKASMKEEGTQNPFSEENE